MPTRRGPHGSERSTRSPSLSHCQSCPGLSLEQFHGGLEMAPHLTGTGLSPIGQELPRDEGSVCGAGRKPQETVDVRMWGRWGSGGCSQKGRLPGGGRVAFRGPKENRFYQSYVALSRKQHCFPNSILCHLDAVFMRQGYIPQTSAS